MVTARNKIKNPAMESIAGNTKTWHQNPESLPHDRTSEAQNLLLPRCTDRGQSCQQAGCDRRADSRPPHQVVSQVAKTGGESTANAEPDVIRIGERIGDEEALSRFLPDRRRMIAASIPNRLISRRSKTLFVPSPGAVVAFREVRDQPRAPAQRSSPAGHGIRQVFNSVASSLNLDRTSTEVCSRKYGMLAARSTSLPRSAMMAPCCWFVSGE